MSDVESEFSFAEALTGLAAIRDYVRVRRDWGLPEDAILGHFYHSLKKDIRAAAEIDHEGFEVAYRVTQVPIDFGEEE